MGLRVPRYTITQLTNLDVGFYETVGPFLCRRDVTDELGSPVWDDDDKTWLVATATDDDAILGFIAVQPHGDTLGIRSLYVLPEVRRDVIGTTLVLRVLHLWPDDPVTATATPAAKELFADCGFEETGTRGKFTLMRLDR